MPRLMGLRDADRLPLAHKVRLSVRAWWWFLRFAWLVRRVPLPTLMERGAQRPGRLRRLQPLQPRVEARRLGRVVERSLWIGPFRPRCLFLALVHHRLLREQGDDAELVIGLPSSPTSHAAHAWVELEGVDVGPPPGRLGHQELARYR